MSKKQRELPWLLEVEVQKPEKPKTIEKVEKKTPVNVEKVEKETKKRLSGYTLFMKYQVELSDGDNAKDRFRRTVERWNYLSEEEKNE